MTKVIKSWDELKNANTVTDADVMSIEQVIVENNNNGYGTLSWNELFARNGYLYVDNTNLQASTSAQNTTTSSIGANNTQNDSKAIQNSNDAASNSTKNDQETRENHNDAASNITKNDQKTTENHNDAASSNVNSIQDSENNNTSNSKKDSNENNNLNSDKNNQESSKDNNDNVFCNTENDSKSAKDNNNNASSSTKNDQEFTENNNNNVSISTENNKKTRENHNDAASSNVNTKQECDIEENSLNNFTIDKEPANIVQEQNSLSNIISEQKGSIQENTNTLDSTVEVIKETIPEVIKETIPEVIKESIPEVIKQTIPEVTKETIPEVIKETIPEVTTVVEMQQKVSKNKSGFDFGDYNSFKVDSVNDAWEKSKQLLHSNTEQISDKPNRVGLSEILDNSPLTFKPRLVNPQDIKKQLNNKINELSNEFSDVVEPAEQEVFSFTRLTHLEPPAETAEQEVFSFTRLTHLEPPAEITTESSETITVDTNSQQIYNQMDDLGNQTVDRSDNEAFNAACDAALEKSKEFCEKTPEFVEKCNTIKQSSLGVIESCKKTYQMILEYEIMQSRGFWLTVFGFIVTGFTYLSYTGKLSFLTSFFKKATSETATQTVSTPITTTNAPVINITNASPNTNAPLDFWYTNIITQTISVIGTGILGFFLRKAPTVVNIVNKYSK